MHLDFVSSGEQPGSKYAVICLKYSDMFLIHGVLIHCRSLSLLSGTQIKIQSNYWHKMTPESLNGILCQGI